GVGQCQGKKCGVASALCTGDHLKVCSGSCVDIRLDPNHCGLCGNECGADKTCLAGLCTVYRFAVEEAECKAALGDGMKCCQHPVSGRPICVSKDQDCAPCP
ncbi:MAG: hypothetical protein EOO74_04615, partial [Myxococcales bacterium]